jgi:hypothetical protein
MFIAMLHSLLSAFFGTNYARWPASDWSLHCNVSESQRGGMEEVILLDSDNSSGPSGIISYYSDSEWLVNGTAAANNGLGHQRGG